MGLIAAGHFHGLREFELADVILDDDAGLLLERRAELFGGDFVLGLNVQADRVADQGWDADAVQLICILGSCSILRVSLTIFHSSRV